MKKYIIAFTFGSILATTLLLSSCEKSKPALAPTETYKIIGTIDAARTNIPTAVLTKAEFTVSYNSGNSFGDAQSILNGVVTLTGFAAPIDTITTKVPIVPVTVPADTTVTRIFLANSFEFNGVKAGANDISYFNIPTTKTTTHRTLSTVPASGIYGNYGTNNYFVYNNSTSASFTVANMPFTNEITSVLKDGKGYIKMGRAPKFVYILLDNVTKL
jgi:hypothetical protein